MCFINHMYVKHLSETPNAKGILMIILILKATNPLKAEITWQLTNDETFCLLITMKQDFLLIEMHLLRKTIHSVS